MDRLEEVVKKGSIADLRQLVYNSSKFHRIKHTRSFALLVDRLEQKDKEIERLKKEKEWLQQALSEVKEGEG